MEDFDWQFNRSIKRKQVFDLAAGAFVREAKDVLLVGPPGVGKSHIAQAVGLAIIKAVQTVLYRSIFDASSYHTTLVFIATLASCGSSAIDLVGT